MLADTESSLKESVSAVSFFEGRQKMSSGEAGPGLTLYGEGIAVSCDFLTGGEVTVIAGDGAIVPILDLVGSFEGDTLVGKRKLVGLG